jgi:hypothetical protein
MTPAFFAAVIVAVVAMFVAVVATLVTAAVTPAVTPAATILAPRIRAMRSSIGGCVENNEAIPFAKKKWLNSAAAGALS